MLTILLLLFFLRYRLVMLPDHLVHNDDAAMKATTSTPLATPMLPRQRS